MKVVNILAMAASYDPDPAQFLGLRLPVTTDTCEIIAERWANWLAHDPVVKLQTQAESLRGLKALYIDCGVADQFNLVYGARALYAAAERTGDPAPLRGIRRQPHRRRLPHGREPALPHQGRWWG